ncbi:MAG: hypothetical protein KF758_11100 [Anaerolineales bacterium]|jgi:hypothetical protein|nr:hypothetical protein [Anaerolineales bacterium]MBX3037444.1 hypothetical protein [Anaerolineales bacterium]NOH00584.1 hypothetical protein [Chloroflexota bacterium]WKZ36331.1 MAG: hypothetical protein QY332_00140 [Anaerolineales bacterium]GJQ36532.1 MAG: hypothetical protein JETCAE01_25420 [Anaerolineaceae bacterium]
MKNITLWIVIGVVALFALGLVGGMFMPFGWNNSAYGYGCDGWNGYGNMMGYRGYMPMMMGGWGMPFGFLGMAFMWLVPLGVLALIVGGIFWLVRTLTQKQSSPS